MRDYEDSVAIIFDRPSGADARQMVFDRMDWTHPQRSGYYEKNKAFIARAPEGLAGMLVEDPVQVMFNGSVGPMRAVFSALRSMAIADQFSVAVTGIRRPRLLARRRQCRGLLEGDDAWPNGRTDAG